MQIFTRIAVVYSYALQWKDTIAFALPTDRPAVARPTVSAHTTYYISQQRFIAMMGTRENPGVIPSAIKDIFTFIAQNQNQREFLLRVSYLEIYNETIRDLLAPENFDLKIHEDKHVRDVIHVIMLVTYTERSLCKSTARRDCNNTRASHASNPIRRR